nr:dienelactone hydrolase family protein [Actinokineospora iranica]
MLLTAGTLVGTEAFADENPYQRGPEPTADALAADAGPFAVTRAAVPAGHGFGGGTVYYPSDDSQGTFAGIAVAPGYVESQSAVAWLGPRLASHGFVVITIDTNTRFDQPESRGTQLLAALDYLTGSSAAKARVDPARLAVMGHSMGGGGALSAAAKRPGLRAAVPLAPWSTSKDWSRVRVPTLVVGAERDAIASVGAHAEPFYQSLGGEKAYLEMNEADHFVVNSATPTVGTFTVSWLKRFVDDDTRYEKFLCPAPSPSQLISEYRDTCPHS